MTPLVTQISWTNHLLIMLGCKTDEEREFYIRLCIKENYSKRQLERQLDSGYYERYMLSKETLLLESVKKLGENPFLDSYVMEFLDLPNEFHENDLRKALIRNMVLCQDLVQVKMRNFSHFNPPEAQPQCVFFYTIVRIHLVTYSYNGYEFVSYCRKLPDI